MSEIKTKLAATEQQSSNITLPVSLNDAPPANPELRKIADDILNSLKYAFAATATNPRLTVKGRADTLFLQFHKTRKDKKKADYQATAQAFLDAPVAVRQATFGRYGTLVPEQYAKVGSDKVSNLVGKLQIAPQNLAAALKRSAEDRANLVNAMTVISKNGKDTSNKKTEDKATGAKYKKLGLYLRKVVCVEETDGFGSDEILMGGTAIGAGGKTSKIGEFTVGEDFDTGEFVDYNTVFGIPSEDLPKELTPPEKLFAEFNLDAGGDEFPKAFGVVMAMAEEDWGGFGDFLNDVWNVVDEKVTAAIGGAVGTLIPIPVLGNILGATIGWIVGKLFGWIAEWIGDDMFKPISIKLTLAKRQTSYLDSLGLTKKSPTAFDVNFIGHGGHYRVWCYWKVHA